MQGLEGIYSRVLGSINFIKIVLLIGKRKQCIDDIISVIKYKYVNDFYTGSENKKFQLSSRVRNCRNMFRKN